MLSSDPGCCVRSPFRNTVCVSVMREMDSWTAAQIFHSAPRTEVQILGSAPSDSYSNMIQHHRTVKRSILHPGQWEVSIQIHEHQMWPHDFWINLSFRNRVCHTQLLSATDRNANSWLSAMDADPFVLNENNGQLYSWLIWNTAS